MLVKTIIESWTEADSVSEGQLWATAATCIKDRDECRKFNVRKWKHLSSSEVSLGEEINESPSRAIPKY